MQSGLHGVLTQREWLSQWPQPPPLTTFVPEEVHTHSVPIQGQEIQDFEARQQQSPDGRSRIPGLGRPLKLSRIVPKDPLIGSTRHPGFSHYCAQTSPPRHTHTLSHPLKLGTPGFPQKRFDISLSLVHRTCCADTRQAQLHFEDPESGSNKTTCTCELCHLLNSRLLIYNMRHVGCASGLTFFSALARPACNAEQSRGPLVGERMGGDLTDS